MDPLVLLSAFVKYTTAVASVGTALALPPLIPKVRHLIDEARDSESAHSRQLVGRIVAAEAEERKHLSYEIHDGITQQAAATHHLLQAFASEYGKLIAGHPDTARLLGIDSDKYADRMDRILAGAQKTVKDARSLIFYLSPTELDDFGLPGGRQIQDRDPQRGRLEHRLPHLDAGRAIRSTPNPRNADRPLRGAP